MCKPPLIPNIQHLIPEAFEIILPMSVFGNKNLYVSKILVVPKCGKIGKAIKSKLQTPDDLWDLNAAWAGLQQQVIVAFLF